MIVIFMINIIVTRFCDRSSRIVSLSFCTQCHLSLLLCRRPHRSIQKQKCRSTKTNTCWLPHRLLLIPNLQIISPSNMSTIKGLGLGIIYLPRLDCITQYFDKKRPLVTGCYNCHKTCHRLFNSRSSKHTIKHLC